MAKTATIRARVDPALKDDAEAIIGALGLTPTEAITIFYTQLTLRGGLPFEVRLPSRATVAAMRDVNRGRRIKRWGTLARLKAELG